MNRATGAHLVVGLAGHWPTPTEAAWLAEHRPCGVILFSRNVKNFKQLYGLCRYLKSVVSSLEISADHEGGPVSQLAGAVGRPPAARGLGVLDDLGLTARVHEETARRLTAAGVDRVYAPVADVMTERHNPVIGARAYGADPVAVTRQVVAAVTGLLSGGAAVCMKHWPGHGATDLDTHRDPAAAASGDLAGPFLAASEAGADAVMAGHLHLAARASDGTPLPATLDAEALATVRRTLTPARDRSPLVICDDATMGGLGPAMEALGVPVPAVEESGLFPPGELPASWLDRLVEAGNDRILLRGIPWAAFPVDRIVQVEEPGPTVDGPAVPDFDPGPYAEARRRLWERAGSGLADSAASLTWLDLSEGDRWQVASGGLDQPEMILETLAGRFAATRRVLDPARIPAGTNRLLVSSHRPVPGHLEALEGLADEGVALVLGHPSLAVDVGAALGPKWHIGALYDVFSGDLFPGRGYPTKI